jgi:ParB-like nuclease family protein
LRCGSPQGAAVTKTSSVIKKPNVYRLSKDAAAKLIQKFQSTKTDTVPTDSVKSNPKNAKLHPEHQIRMLAENIELFGFTQPILIDEVGMILAGTPAGKLPSFSD